MPANRVEAVERALTILNCFSSDQPFLSLKQLAERTGFYKSTILRLAGSLEAFGYLTRQADGRYHLGMALIGLGNQAKQHSDQALVIRPVLEQLRDRFNESVAYYVRQGNQRICLYRANANRAIRHQLEEGQALPLERGAGGRLLLAYSGEAGPVYGRIRQQGWYLSRGERDPEVASLGVPILARDGGILAALCLSGLLSRFSRGAETHLLPELREQARALSHQLDPAAGTDLGRPEKS